MVEEVVEAAVVVVAVVVVVVAADSHADQTSVVALPNLNAVM